MDSMEIEYEYRREDEIYRAQRFTQRTGAADGFARSRQALLAWASFAALVMAILTRTIAPGGVLAGVVVILIWGHCRNLWNRIRISADDSSPMYGRRICRIDDKGIAVENAQMKLWFGWPTIREIEDHGGYISIYYDSVRALPLPKKSFRSQEELDKFFALLRTFARASKIGEKPGPVTASPIAALRPRFPIFALVLGFMLVLWFNTVAGLNGIDQKPDVSTTVDEASTVGDSIVVLGKIKNPGKSDWQLSALTLTFYNAQGKFIDQCTTYTYGLRVAAGATENFKASCSALGKEAVAAGAAVAGSAIMPATLKHYARVEVKVGNGFRGDLFSPFKFW
jgi:hypothetical protein